MLLQFFVFFSRSKHFWASALAQRDSALRRPAAPHPAALPPSVRVSSAAPRTHLTTINHRPALARTRPRCREDPPQPPSPLCSCTGRPQLRALSQPSHRPPSATLPRCTPAPTTGTLVPHPHCTSAPVAAAAHHLPPLHSSRHAAPAGRPLGATRPASSRSSTRSRNRAALLQSTVPRSPVTMPTTPRSGDITTYCHQREPASAKNSPADES